MRKMAAEPKSASISDATIQMDYNLFYSQSVDLPVLRDDGMLTEHQKGPQTGVYKINLRFALLVDGPDNRPGRTTLL